MKVQKVLVMAIDPYVNNPVTGTRERASEYLGFSLNLSITSLKQFIELGTHGEVQIDVVDSIHCDEFPRYVGFPSMTEEQFFRLFPANGSGKGEWYGWWERNRKMKIIPREVESGMYFDYVNFIIRYELVELRNQGCFDMVWVFGIDPLSMYESSMIGENPFWINGNAFQTSCENFAMFGMTFSRPDGALEDFCHMCEDMLNYTYGVSIPEFRGKLEFNDFSELNTWQKFYLCKHNSPAHNKVYGVGQVHFSPNSVRDYDWENHTPVQSYHRAFLEDYLEITTKKLTTFTAREYLNDGDYDDGPVSLVKHHIWWMQHMPHFPGRDENGYRHNWWDYILDLKYVEGLEAIEGSLSNTIRIPLGESVTDVPFVIRYNGNRRVDTSLTESEAVLKYKENAVFTVENGKICGKTVGKESLTVLYDGHALKFIIEVL